MMVINFILSLDLFSFKKAFFLFLFLIVIHFLLFLNTYPLKNFCQRKANEVKNVFLKSSSAKPKEAGETGLKQGLNGEQIDQVISPQLSSTRQKLCPLLKF